MKKNLHLLFITLMFFMLASCTSARWTVKNGAATDRSDYEILEQHQFLKISGEVTPEDPVLRFDLLSRTKYEYAQKVLVQRSIQDYRLRPGFTALGLTGAAMAFFVANSSTFRGNSTSPKSMVLNAAGAVLALSGIFNMKPVGEPRPTGEERFLRSTGSTVEIDTAKVQHQELASAMVEMSYQGQVIFKQGNRNIFSGKLEIPLAAQLKGIQIQGQKPGSVTVNLAFKDSAYTYKYPVEKILQPYARISSQVTELRNSPEESADNILAGLVKGSQVPVQNYENEQWLQVLYGGISENYILKEDAQLIWRPSDFAHANEIVTVPRIPFGNVDVESNIPILRGSAPNAIGLIVANENYSGGLPKRTYAIRDGKLVQTYLENALGFTPQKIFSLTDITDSNQLYRTLSEIRFAANDSTQFFVYLSGYGSIEQNEEGVELSFLSVNGEETGSSAEQMSLRKLFEQLSTIPASQKLVLGDIDFSQRMQNVNISPNEGQRVLESYAAELTDSGPATSLLMGAQLGQPSSLYVSEAGEDKKHHIFPYFFAKALQQRNTNLSAIYQFLERNVSYTSRRLHDRPQDPLLLGDVFLDLTN